MYVVSNIQFHRTTTADGELQIGETAGFVRSDDAALFPPDEFKSETAPEDLTSGVYAPDIELISSPVAWKEHGIEQVPNWGSYSFTLHAVALRYICHVSSFESPLNMLIQTEKSWISAATIKQPR